MAIRGFNGKIPCRPVERKGVEAQIKSGFATVKQKGQLLKLDVLFPSGRGEDEVFRGDSVYVKGEQIKAAWALEEFEVGGETVILVPTELVQLYERN